MIDDLDKLQIRNLKILLGTFSESWQIQLTIFILIFF